MNERIRKLAEQAGFVLWYGAERRYRKKQIAVDWACNYDDELKKYTELIVRECALTAGLMEHQGRKNIGAQILDNFGIKENE